MKARAIITIARDLGFLIFGFGGVVFQQLTGRVNVYLLMVYTAMLGLPGGLALLQLARGRPETPPTPSPSLESQRSSSPPP